MDVESLAGSLQIMYDAWKNIQDSGIKLLLKLSNDLVETSFTNDSINWGVLAKNTKLHNLVKAKLAQDREVLLTALAQELIEFKDVYLQLKTSLYEMKASADMLAHEAKTKNTSSIFDYESLITSAAVMYGQDLKCKQDILLDLTQLSRQPTSLGPTVREDLQVYASIWQEHPYLNLVEIKRIEKILLGSLV